MVLRRAVEQTGNGRKADGRELVACSDLCHPTLALAPPPRPHAGTPTVLSYLMKSVRSLSHSTPVTPLPLPIYRDTVAPSQSLPRPIPSPQKKPKHERGCGAFHLVHVTRAGAAARASGRLIFEINLQSSRSIYTYMYITLHYMYMYMYSIFPCLRQAADRAHRNFLWARPGHSQWILIPWAPSLRGGRVAGRSIPCAAPVRPPRVGASRLKALVRRRSWSVRPIVGRSWEGPVEPPHRSHVASFTIHFVYSFTPWPTRGMHPSLRERIVLVCV